MSDPLTHHAIHIWPPFTQQKNAPPPCHITSAKGCYLVDSKGNSYVDAISSWWVNIHGHAHPIIAEAIYKQAQKLEHVIFAGFTHDPALDLCKRLASVLPNQLNHAFFSDNGSTAVEVALKMSYQFFKNRNEERPLFLSFLGNYHGDTIGAMSLGSSGYHTPFQHFMFQTQKFPLPKHTPLEATPLKELSPEEGDILDQINTFLKANNQRVAAFIIEPLVQGAFGMKMCSALFLRHLCELMKEWGILTIFDEVMTGFHRTGTLFALERIGVVPDFLCLSKGLTGGFLPLALTFTQSRIHDAFLSDSFEQAFLHGHSYTANPLGCAAAIASFDLLGLESTRSALHTIHKGNLTHLAYLYETFESIVSDVRCFGTIAAFDMKVASHARELQGALMGRGIIIRPLGRSVYIMPPYCISDELERIYSEIFHCLKVFA